jgi:hypothetical protein
MLNQCSQRETDFSLWFLIGINYFWYVSHYEGEHQTEDYSEGHYKVREILSDDLNDMVIEDVKSS